MSIDFQEHFGVNAGYVEDLYERWKADSGQVDPEWARWFESVEPGASAAGATGKASPSDAANAGGADGSKPTPAQVEVELETEHVKREQLKGVAGRIVQNMNASLELPTATSVRTLPVKVLDENRKVVNAHMQVRALGKASYTHIIAYAIVRALAEQPNMQSSLETVGKKNYRATPKQVNLGIAIDVPVAGGRQLVVPNIKGADRMTFKQFYDAYQDVVARGREGKLTAKDYANTTVTLTNPGGFGTEMSVPRLMQGQGLIIATGGIGVPVQNRFMAPKQLAELGVGPVMTVTSTYDHRVIQGAESGLMLKRMEELLDGADGFWNDVFSCMRVPWTPFRPDRDHHGSADQDPATLHARVWMMINAYRVRGCQLADLDPLEYKPDPLPSLDPTFYGFTIWDLDRQYKVDGMCGQEQMRLREILEVLRESYCRRWTVEYMHITDRVRKHWVREAVEMHRHDDVFDLDHRKRILRRLIRAENFERFLQTRYPGNKRFSLEGGDMLVPALAEILDRGAARGVKRAVIGMAHRGRLNVLAHILGKSHDKIFREFEGVLLPLKNEGSGDVKYHQGQRGVFRTNKGEEVEVILCANPSHLEAVNPVVCGAVRGYQAADGDSERTGTIGILVHGDAAFTGQGVVAENLQMSGLPGFTTGGTIHLVVNNQIGFTAGPRDLHTTYYCTDMAKMVQAPIMHANGDFPESVLRACHLAVDFQRQFGEDTVVDLVCYRRRGHNEGDEPMYTQPQLYQRIHEHPTVRENYIGLLQRRGLMTADECQALSDGFDAELREALKATKEEAQPEPDRDDVIDLDDGDDRDWSDQPSPQTGLPKDVLVGFIETLNTMPDDLVVHPNLLRQLHRRERMVHGERDLDWGCGEAAAFASVLTAGTSIRLAGQDSGRGTFSHRHAVIRNQAKADEHIPLQAMAAAKHGGSAGDSKSTGPCTFEVHDSFLSEEAVLAFEYGYGLARPEVMGIWEAQFGDFVNGAQIPIDQFLSSGESKWGQRIGLTLLLPHGYDGQGPEHSSARIERFLTLSAEGNWVIANCTNTSQFFHLMRRQALHLPEGGRKPLVVFTPKSLLRDPRAASAIEELEGGRFLELVPNQALDGSGAMQTESDATVNEKVTRVLLCSGRIYHDLAKRRQELGRDDVAIMRLEQLYPFPRAALREELAKYTDAELIWVQEEPSNMGPWGFVKQRLQLMNLSSRYTGRPSAASPATGSYRRHQAEEEYILEQAFG